ncbi:nuclease-related domain-containing protein [Lysinibacillus sp. LZ02]|uniref:nuclease-related domain-containing protein n=1 Tax=Lysinibacillus sp. LZ02 TaxID=3420668 RepID=UPI003D36B73E
MFKGLMKKIVKTIDSHRVYQEATGNSLLKVLFDKGLTGEYLSFFKMNTIPGEHRTLFNMYIPKKRGGYTEVDLVFIHETGIYVAESKNYSAWIYGNGEQKNWTQVFPNGKEYSFYNPIKQNEAHIRALQHVLPALPQNLFINLVVFSERCKLKEIEFTQERTYVMKRPELKELLLKLVKYRKVIFTPAQIQAMYDSLKQYEQVDERIVQEHRESVQKYQR